MKKLIFLFLLKLLIAKVLIVNSYSTNDQCGIPQLEGFLEKMYENNYSIEDFDIYFLNARTSSKKELIKKSKNILKNLKKYDFVVTFDDTAFRYVGIPASRYKWVYFSGLNRSYKEYEKEFNLSKNIAGVYERLYIKNMLDTFSKIKPINKIACFYSKGIGEIIKNQIKDEIKNTRYEKKIDFIFINDYNMLNKKTKEINDNKQYTLFIPLCLKTKKENKFLPFLKFKDIYLKNIKKPDVSLNLNFVNLGFLGFGGVDFEKMGEQLADLVVKNPKNHIIEDAKYKTYFINSNRAREINFKLPLWFLKKCKPEIY